MDALVSPLFLNFPSVQPVQDLTYILPYKGGLQIPIPIYLLFLTVKESLKSGSGLANGARLGTNNIGELMP